jgi:hypothetical protein
MGSPETEIRTVIDGWAVWRDSGAWSELRATFHDDGRMKTTWLRGSADDFVDASRKGFEAGVTVHHFLGGTTTEIHEGRAIAQTKMSISQRLFLDEIEIDVTCFGRFYDFFEKRHGAWKIVLREPIYEKDRIDPVHPGEIPRIDSAVLAGFPYGCRHLLYCQSVSGMNIHTDVPGLRGEAIEALYVSGRDWLAGLDLGR